MLAIAETSHMNNQSCSLACKRSPNDSTCGSALTYATLISYRSQATQAKLHKACVSCYTPAVALLAQIQNPGSASAMCESQWTNMHMGRV